MEPSTKVQSGSRWVKAIGLGFAFGCGKVGADLGRELVGGEVGKWLGIILFVAMAAAAFSWMLRRYGEIRTGQIAIAFILYLLIPIFFLALSLHWAGLDF